MQYFGFLAFYLQDSYLKNGKYEKTDFNGGGGADGSSRGVKWLQYLGMYSSYLIVMITV